MRSAGGADSAEDLPPEAGQALQLLGGLFSQLHDVVMQARASQAAAGDTKADAANPEEAPAPPPAKKGKGPAGTPCGQTPSSTTKELSRKAPSATPANADQTVDAMDTKEPAPEASPAPVTPAAATAPAAPKKCS